MLLVITIFIAVFCVVLGVGLVLMERRTNLQRLGGVVAAPESATSGRRFGLVSRRSMASMLAPFQKVLPRSANEASVIQKRLIRAGFRKDAHLNVFYGTKFLVPVVLIIAATVTRVYEYGPFFVYAIAGGLGFLIPDFVLGNLMGKRQLNIRLGLPDALDLMVICIEAGLGIDQAVNRVAEELRISHPVISDEFTLVNLEQRAGLGRAESWRNLSQRTDVDTLQAVIASILQADQFGTSVAKALRTHSETLRTQRRQKAEEEAAKTTVKLVFPLVFCIFPSLFTVALAPSMIVLLEGIQKFLID